MAEASRSAPRIAAELAARLEGATKPVSVLIEAEVPTPRSLIRRDPRAPGRDTPDVRPLRPDELKERDGRIEDLRVLLREVLGAEPRYFKYSNAFGATVSREQLDRIARSPLVRVVRENRSLRK